MSFIDKFIYKFLGGKITYSQCGEDIIMHHVLSTLNVKNFSYLDIGTNDPRKANNTYKFYRLGNTGVCVEPNPSLVKLIKRKRPKDKCLNVGVSLSEDAQADFYIMDQHTLSTFSKEDAEELAKVGSSKITQTIRIPLKNINSIIAENFETCPEVVSIDVEGLNQEIALSLDLNRFRPKVLCLETITYSEGINGERLTGIIDHMVANGFIHYADTNINSIFIDSKA